MTKLQQNENLFETLNQRPNNKNKNIGIHWHLRNQNKRVVHVPILNVKKPFCAFT